MKQRQTISDIAECVKQEMERLKYAPDTIKTFGLKADKLSQYVRENYGNDFFTEEIGQKYLRDTIGYPFSESRPLSCREGEYLRCVRRIGEYQQFGAVSRFRINTPIPISEWAHNDEPWVVAFVEAMQTADNSEATKKLRINHIRYFYLFLSSRKISGVREISSQIISDYVTSLQGYSPVFNRHRLATLRRYFRFLRNNNYVDIDWSFAVPRMVVTQSRNIPKIWEKSEVELLLNSIDRGNPTGKRDYAIILLVAQLGLRISDIANLRLDNLKWERKEIELKQHKTKKLLVQPLLPNVGWAIIDYIKNGRPKMDSSYVFLAAIAPYGNIMPGSIGDILARCLSRCGIPKKKGISSGMHSLRHALARRLLEAGTPLPTVADVMGHTNYCSTSPYLRVDIDGLRECALSLTMEEVRIDD